MNKHKDDLELPDMPVEPDPLPPEIVPVIEAQPPAPAPVVVKTYDRSAWIRKLGPKPPSAGMRVLDFVIVGLLFCTALVIVQALAWAIFS